MKKAVGLLENVFSKEQLLTSDHSTDLFDVIRDYTYALDTLDAYDHQCLKIADTTAPERFHATYENAIKRLKGKTSTPALRRRLLKAHLRCLPCSSNLNDSREPHGRNGHDGKGSRQPDQPKELVRFVTK